MYMFIVWQEGERGGAIDVPHIQFLSGNSGGKRDLASSRAHAHRCVCVTVCAYACTVYVGKIDLL